MAHKRRITNLEQLRNSIQAVVEYNYHDEKRDFDQNPESRVGHIFQHLRALDEWLNHER